MNNRLLSFPRLSERARMVFSAVYAAPGVSLSELSGWLKLPVPRVAEIVERLEWLNLVITRKDSRRRCYPAKWTVNHA